MSEMGANREALAEDRGAVAARLFENFDHHDPALDHVVLSELYRRFASSCPVAHTDAHGGFTVVANYDDLVEIEKNTAVYSSAQGVLHPSHAESGRSIPIEFDAPLHTAYRKLFMDVLSAPHVRRIEPVLRELTDRLLDEYLAGDERDFVQHVAVQLPIRAVGVLLGIGESASDRIQQFGLTILEHFGTPKMMEALQDLAVYALAQVEERRTNPRDDYVTKLIGADLEGRPLTDEELVNIFRTFFFAGFETTARAISNMVHHLAVHPDLQARLRADATLIPNAVEESLRALPPVQTMFRTVTQPAQLRGETLKPGDRVALLFAAANRDPAVFEDGETFHLDRENARQHVAFGFGAHFCAGAPLARAEMRILLEALLNRPQFELAGEPRWLPRLMMGQMMGINYLPLRFG